MRSPQTVALLNAEILTSFNVLECSRAYIQFPFSLQLEGKECSAEKRIVMQTLALKGPEALCCEQIWKALIEPIGKEEREDAYAILFVRRWFIYESDERVLYGRVAFYNTKYQKALLANRAWKGEGYTPNTAIREKE